MKLSHYLFEHSYLMDFEYNPISSYVKLKIDAMITYEHPKANINLEEATFVDVEIIFEGVQYFEVLSSFLLKSNPNDDLGSIEYLGVGDNFDTFKDIHIFRGENKYKLEMDLLEDDLAVVFTDANEFIPITFASEMISFKLGCREITINES